MEIEIFEKKEKNIENFGIKNLTNFMYAVGM